MFVLTRQGALHLVEQVEGNDQYEADVGGGLLTSRIDAQLITRRYTYGDMNTKRFNRYKALVFGENGTGKLEVYADTVDPESSTIIEGRQVVEDGEDYNLGGRIGRRGYGIQLRFLTSRAKVRGCSVEAIVNSRSNIDRA